jgi:hypothetical protein
MNQLAVASAKAGGRSADLDDDERRLRDLEQRAWAVEAEQAMRHEVEHPAAAQYAAGVLLRVRLDQQQRNLEAWAMRQPPPQPEDPTARQRAQWERNNAYSNALARTMANATTCGHRSCMPGRCAYNAVSPSAFAFATYPNGWHAFAVDGVQLVSPPKSVPKPVAEGVRRTAFFVALCSPFSRFREAPSAEVRSQGSLPTGLHPRHRGPPCCPQPTSWSP